MSHIVYIALGSNLGARAHNMKSAIKTLASVVNFSNISPIYETPPWGYAHQPAFLNQVARGETDLTPAGLLACLKQIENDMGRVRTITNGPRPIDLDILFYDDLIQDTPGLTLPHPRLEGRAFVLKPLADLVPEMVHPLFGKTIRQM